MISHCLYDDGQHQWWVLGRDPNKSEDVIDTNEYVVVSNGDALLLDPGGTEIFPPVLRELSKLVRLDQIKTIFSSHQDPDVISSLPMWMGLCPQATVHMPWLWRGFIMHFGAEYASRFVSIPDPGGELPIGTRGRKVQLVPAHFMHSAGNFHVYDPDAKLLFSGDIGAALLPADYKSLFVEDVGQHIRFMEGFHRRWLGSNEAKLRWIQRVRKLDIQTLAPQHGAIFRGPQVGEFLDWLEQLEVGLDGSMTSRDAALA